MAFGAELADKSHGADPRCLMLPDGVVFTHAERCHAGRLVVPDPVRIARWQCRRLRREAAPAAHGRHDLQRDQAAGGQLSAWQPSTLIVDACEERHLVGGTRPPVSGSSLPGRPSGLVETAATIRAVLPRRAAETRLAAGAHSAEIGRSSYLGGVRSGGKPCLPLAPRHHRHDLGGGLDQSRGASGQA